LGNPLAYAVAGTIVVASIVALADNLGVGLIDRLQLSYVASAAILAPISVVGAAMHSPRTRSRSPLRGRLHLHCRALTEVSRSTASPDALTWRLRLARSQ
jgi:hypothetical protein